jgi:hypothetical protein
VPRPLIEHAHALADRQPARLSRQRQAERIEPTTPDPDEINSDNTGAVKSGREVEVDGSLFGLKYLSDIDEP